MSRKQIFWWMVSRLLALQNRCFILSRLDLPEWRASHPVRSPSPHDSRTLLEPRWSTSSSQFACRAVLHPRSELLWKRAVLLASAARYRRHAVPLLHDIAKEPHDDEQSRLLHRRPIHLHQRWAGFVLAAHARVQLSWPWRGQAEHGGSVHDPLEPRVPAFPQALCLVDKRDTACTEGEAFRSLPQHEHARVDEGRVASALDRSCAREREELDDHRGELNEASERRRGVPRVHWRRGEGRASNGGRVVSDGEQLLVVWSGCAKAWV